MRKSVILFILFLIMLIIYSKVDVPLKVDVNQTVVKKEVENKAGYLDSTFIN